MLDEQIKLHLSNNNIICTNSEVYNTNLYWLDVSLIKTMQKKMH